MAQGRARTGKPALLKELNMGLIMDALQKKGQATRVELAALTGLSQPTVNLLIRELVKEQTVCSLGIAGSTGGRRAEVFALNGKRAALAAVIVRMEEMEAVTADLDLHIELREKRARTQGASCTEELVSLLQSLFEKRPEIRAVCVGVPGSVSADGAVFSIPAIPEWERFALKEELERRFPAASVRIINDMNAVAAGYLPNGREQGREEAQNFVYLHAEGIGVGAGIVIGGKLYSGFRSFAGEVGSMLLGKAEGLGGAGSEGEGFISSKITVEGSMRRAAQDGDRTAVLTAAAVNLICVLNPEKILIGGDVTEETVQKIREGCCRYLPPMVQPRFQRITDYKGDYFYGLCRQGQEMLSRHVRVV